MINSKNTIKDNNGKYRLRKEADGYSIIDFDTMQIIGTLNKDFEGETDDCFVKYDTKKDILYFDKKIKYQSNYSTYEDDRLIEDGWATDEHGHLIRAGEL